jgi:hypothetical protein
VFRLSSFQVVQCSGYISRTSCSLVAHHWYIRKMSGMFYPERHVYVVWGNKTPSREVFFQSLFLLSPSEENNTKNENIM